MRAAFNVLMTLIFTASTCFAESGANSARESVPAQQALILSMKHWSDVVQFVKTYLRAEDVQYMQGLIKKARFRLTDETGIKSVADGVKIGATKLTFDGLKLSINGKAIEINPKLNIEQNLRALYQNIGKQKALISLLIPEAKAGEVAILDSVFQQLAIGFGVAVVTVAALAGLIACVASTTCAWIALGAIVAFVFAAATMGSRAQAATCDGNNMTVTGVSGRSVTVQIPSTTDQLPSGPPNVTDAAKLQPLKSQMADAANVLKKSPTCRALLDGTSASVEKDLVPDTNR